VYGGTELFVVIIRIGVEWNCGIYNMVFVSFLTESDQISDCISIYFLIVDCIAERC
jgi:hypothetical protein